MADPTELTEAEATGYWLELLAVARAVEARYRPAKLNLEMLGNAVPHLHTHVVPRYVDDPDPGRPPSFLAHGVAPELDEAAYGREAEALAAAMHSRTRSGGT